MVNPIELPPPTYLTIPPTGFQYNSSGLQLRKLQDAYSENNLKPKSKGKKKNKKPKASDTHTYSKC